MKYITTIVIEQEGLSSDKDMGTAEMASVVGKVPVLGAVDNCNANRNAKVISAFTEYKGKVTHD